MKKRKILFLITVCFLICLVCLACTSKKEDIVYGDWEGNYFYAKNFRVKTDGSDFEVVVDRFVDGQKTYYFNDKNVYAATPVGDNMILTVSFAEEENTERDNRAILLYNIKDKTCKLIATTGLTKEKNEEVSVKKCTEDFFIVEETDVAQRTRWYSFKYDGTVDEEDATLLAQSMIIGNRMFREIEGSLCYAQTSDKKFKSLFRCQSTYAGKAGSYVKRIYPDVYYYKGYVFNPVTEKINRLADTDKMMFFENGKYIAYYAVTYEPGDYSYIGGADSNCMIRINEDCSVQKVAVFPKGSSFNPTEYSDDKKYINFQCQYVDGTSQNYVFVKETQKLHKGVKTVKEEENDEKGLLGNGVRCDKYYYEYYYGATSSFFGVRRTGFLLRYDSEKKETVYMQYLGSDDKKRTVLFDIVGERTEYTVKPY